MKIIFSIVLVGLLIGCGGGDTSSEYDTPNESIQTGLIIDSQISGLRYVSTNKDKTQIKEGITNSKGEFEYFENGITEFFVGNIKIADTVPNKLIAITTIAKTEQEAQNIARFLQTIDEDGDPDNGIEIPSAVDENAKNDKVSLKFDDSFESDFDSVKIELFKHTANIPATISVEQALSHSSKSERLSSLKEFDLYKAIANEKSYNSPYYNTDILKNDQSKRFYLWIWENLLLKEMAIEDELQFTKPEFDLNNVEETRDNLKKYIDYADALNSIISLGKDTYENILEAGDKSYSYELLSLSSLSIGGCDAVVKLYNADGSDAQTLNDTDICKNIMKILNPVDDSSSALAVTNPILSSFLPSVLPTLLKTRKMNWLNFDTKSLRTISKVELDKPDVISIALSILNMSNDLYGSYWASDINEELSTRMIAREWLSVLFRSGLDQNYMNKLINDNSSKLITKKDQIEAIALKLGSTGALCDLYDFFIPFYECTGIENINYNYNEVEKIIDEKTLKLSSIYTNLLELVGPITDEEGGVGIIQIEETLSSGDSIKLSGKLSIYDMNGKIESEFPSNVNVQFSAKCEDTGSGIKTLYENYNGIVSSDGFFEVDLNSYEMNDEQQAICSKPYTLFFYIDANRDGLYNYPDIHLHTIDTDKTRDINVSVFHLKVDEQIVKGDDFEVTDDMFVGVKLEPDPLSHVTYQTEYYYSAYKISNGKISIDRYEANIDYSNIEFFIFPSTLSSSTQAIFENSLYLARTNEVTLLSSLQLDSELLLYNGQKYIAKKSPITGVFWMMQNIGGGTYGNLIQWGAEYESSFISGTFDNAFDWDYDADPYGLTRKQKWATTDGSSICPRGYHVPTLESFKAEIADNNEAFYEFFNPQLAGSLAADDGTRLDAGTHGYYWTNDINNTKSLSVTFYDGTLYTDQRASFRASALSVRCIRD